MKRTAFRALLAGLCAGIAVTLGRQRLNRTGAPRAKSAWPDLAGEFAL